MCGRSHRMYWKSASTISSILAKKKEMKEADVAERVNVLAKQGSQTIKYVEKLLVSVNEQQLAKDSVLEAIIYKKARLLHVDLTKKMPITGAAVSEFKASRGWFDKFKKWTDIHSVVRQKESSIKVKVMLNIHLSISLVIYIYFSLFSVCKTIVILYKMYFYLYFWVFGMD